MKKTIFIFSLLTSAAFTSAQTVINLSLPAQAEELQVNAGNDVTITEGESTTLNATVNGGSPDYSYRWTPAGSLTDNTTASPEASPVDTTSYIVTVLDQQGCMVIDTVVVNVKEYISALKNHLNSNVNIYPNPVKDYFFITLPEMDKTSKVSLMTTDGKTIWQKIVAGNSLEGTRFDAPDSPGLYFISIETENQTYTQPVVVSQNK